MCELSLSLSTMFIARFLAHSLNSTHSFIPPCSVFFSLFFRFPSPLHTYVNARQCIFLQLAANIAFKSIFFNPIASYLSISFYSSDCVCVSSLQIFSILSFCFTFEVWFLNTLILFLFFQFRFFIFAPLFL